MTIQELIIKYAKQHGYDGLCKCECGCEILTDLAPCGSRNIEECEFGYVSPCEECTEEEQDACEHYSSDYDSMILPEKCRKRLEKEKEQICQLLWGETK